MNSNPTDTPPLCPVHKRIDELGTLEMQIGGLNCLACTLQERVEASLHRCRECGMPYVDGSDFCATCKTFTGPSDLALRRVSSPDGEGEAAHRLRALDAIEQTIRSLIQPPVQATETATAKQLVAEYGLQHIAALRYSFAAATPPSLPSPVTDAKDAEIELSRPTPDKGEVARRAAEKWFQDARAEIERRRHETGFISAVASLDAAVTKLASIIEAELGAKE